jgi:hypothetical protein
MPEPTTPRSTALADAANRLEQLHAAALGLTPHREVGPEDAPVLLAAIAAIEDLQVILEGAATLARRAIRKAGLR